MNDETVSAEIQTTLKSWRWIARCLLEDSEMKRQRTNKRLQQTAALIRNTDERLSFKHGHFNFTHNHRLTPARTA